MNDDPNFDSDEDDPGPAELAARVGTNVFGFRPPRPSDLDEDGESPQGLAERVSRRSNPFYL